ncbi:CWF19-like protein 1 homolog [Drosophila yakuba]|uniref:CWF19-like protein 1 homolog n=1 Tax=Drosophila yakuba TaxID=7245 RepID=UPI0019307C72|nr:CWF19-like protein 1 homolog [Drosophila yakuba]
MLPEMGPYFLAELPDDSTLITRQMKHFPIHFARDVFCSENLLNTDSRDIDAAQVCRFMLPCPL